MTRLVFLGTPSSALPTLKELAARHEIRLVVTQPDRPKGRSKKPVASPVKDEAIELGLPIAQPETRSELYDQIVGAGHLDVGVVVAYGRILRPEILEIPDRGLLNVHFSLLPRWRGAAPVARAIMAGDEMTGVTILKLDEGLDTGPVLTAQAIDIRRSENAGQLTDRLATMGARLLASALEEYLAGELEPFLQSNEGATYADKITSADRPLDVRRTTVELMNQVRGLAPDPAATLDIDGDHHKIFAVSPHESSPVPGAWEAHQGLPVVGTADGGLALLELQPPGRGRQGGADWLRGRRRSEGAVAR